MLHWTVLTVNERQVCGWTSELQYNGWSYKQWWGEKENSGLKFWLKSNTNNSSQVNPFSHSSPSQVNVTTRVQVIYASDSGPSRVIKKGTSSQLELSPYNSAIRYQKILEIHNLQWV